MSEAHLSVRYIGPAVDSGSMDVKALAPSLLALGKLLEEANRTLNGDRARIQVRVQSDFKAGSFEVDFNVVQDFVEWAKGALTGQDVTAALNLAAMLGIATTSAVGLLKLLKWLRGRSPTRAVTLQDGNVRLEVNVSETIVISRPVLALFQDVGVRDAATQLALPLSDDGISAIEFKQGSDVADRIEKIDLPSFAAPVVPDDKILETKYEKAFSIVSLAFREGNKWRLYDGQNEIFATIEDEDFLRRVNDGTARFGKGDILVCDVVGTQYRTPRGLKAEYVVRNVREHKTSAPQLSLSLEAPELPPS